MPCTRSCCTSASRLSDNCAPRLTTLIAVVATASQMVHYGGQYIDHGTTDISDTSGISDGGGPFLLYACITFAVVWLIIVAMLRYRKMKVYLMGAPTGNATGQFAGQRPSTLTTRHAPCLRARAQFLYIFCMQPWCVQNHGRRHVTVDCTRVLERDGVLDRATKRRGYQDTCEGNHVQQVGARCQ